MARLEALPAWSWDPYKDDWGHAFGVLEQYLAEHGHALVPDDRKLYQGIKLGTWVSHQRRWYRQGRLGAEAVARLEALPGWSWNPHADAWERAFSLLERYVAERGHAQPSAREESEGFGLGTWVSNQRTRRHTLAPSRIALLEALPGWVWQATG